VCAEGGGYAYDEGEWGAGRVGCPTRSVVATCVLTRDKEQAPTIAPEGGRGGLVEACSNKRQAPLSLRQKPYKIQPSQLQNYHLIRE